MKHELYTVSHRSSDKLIIKRKTSRFVRDTFIGLLILAFLIASMANQSDKEGFINKLKDGSSNIFLWPFIGFGLYEIIQNLWKLFTGDQLIIDKTQTIITKNKQKAIDFLDVSFVQIRKYRDSDNNITYRLSLVKTDGENLFIDRSSNEDGIVEMAEEIADFLGKEIKWKNKNP